MIDANLTKRQREILSYLTTYSEEYGYAPSFEEIAQMADQTPWLQRIADVSGFQKTAPQIPLEELEPDAAVALLRQLGVDRRVRLPAAHRRRCPATEDRPCRQ